MTNYEIYKKIEKNMKKKNLSYRALAKKLKTSHGSLHDKMTRLKNGKSVYTQFLIQLEEVFEDPIFFG